MLFRSYVTVGDQQVIARVDAHSQAQMGRPAEIVFNMRKMHLFNPQTTMAIL